MATDSALVVVEQDVSRGMVEWNLDDFPEDRFNRLLPTQTPIMPTDLLRPVVQVVKLNPDPNAGDVYSSRDMPNGHSAPTRVALRKLATAAGISFIEETRTDDGSNPDVIEVSTIAEMLLPTGQRIRATGTKRIDLNAQSWASDAQRAKYKSFFFEHVASRAQNRAIRALLSLRGSYPTQLYNRPFAVLSYTPNYDHPEVRTRMLEAMTGAAAQLYGPAAAKQLAAGPAPINVTPAAEEDPAPPAPIELPGESIAKAAPSEVPAWLAPADPAPAAAATKSIVDALRESAESSDLKGGLTKPQQEKLQAILTPLDWASETEPVLSSAWDGFDGNFTARQANAIVVVADSYGSVEAFLEAWRQASA